MLIASSAAQSQTFYSNGNPNLQNGFEMTSYYEADGIPVNGALSFDTLTFWTLQTSVQLQTVEVTFSEDGGGVPGSTLWSGVETVSSVPTGRSLIGLYNEYVDTVFLGPVSLAGDEMFYMTLIGDPVSDPNHGAEGVYWETTDFTGLQWSLNRGALDPNWHSNTGDQAFFVSTVPEPPSSFVPLGFGILAYRRYRLKGKFLRGKGG
jgi:hypothetical protein